MTEQEIEKLNNEFSNEFDVLYNNITSNQAPGLDEYEKSVFLTKAQNEIVKAYFNPKTNKVQEGFDGNEKRQIDFSMIMRSISYETLSYVIVEAEANAVQEVLNTLFQVKSALTEQSNSSQLALASNYIINSKFLEKTEGPSAIGKPKIHYVNPFTDSFFDGRSNTKSVALENDILMLVNEYVEISREKNTKRLTILPINYTEYSRLMSKPYKRPLKNQAWRLLDNSDGYKKAEIVVGPNDIITKYVIRYVKRPRAIRLTTFDEVTLDGGNTAQCCELDPILFPEIIQRACELAKAAYIGDLQSQIALGQASQTNIGMVTQSR